MTRSNHAARAIAVLAKARAEITDDVAAADPMMAAIRQAIDLGLAAGKGDPDAANADPLMRERKRADALANALTEMRTAQRQRALGAYETISPGEIERGVRADIALGLITPEDAPLARVAQPLEHEHHRNLAKIRHSLEQHAASITRDQEYRIKYPSEESADEASKTAQYDRNQAEKTAQLKRDLARAETMAAHLAQDARSVLVPLGTIVRTRTPVILPGDWPMPKAGSTGVITGYSTLANRPNVVSFLGNVEETDGSICLDDDDKPHQVNYQLDELDVVGPGRLMDGTPVETAGWWPTHSHGTKSEILYSESMVVAAGGKLWRIQPCSGLPERTQTTTDDEVGRKRFDFLKPLQYKDGSLPDSNVICIREPNNHAKGNA